MLKKNSTLFSKGNRIWTISVIVTVFIAILTILLWRMVTGGLSKTEGLIEVSALTGNIEIVRAQEGFSHIIGKTEEELFFAPGYAHAQDRMYQMELLRRTIAGRLSEVVGEPGVASDKYFRTIELYKLAISSFLSSGQRTKENYEAYARGVNTWIEEKNSLSPEFLILGSEIAPWTPVDSVAAIKSLAYALSANSFTEVLRTDYLLQNGPDQTEKRFPAYPEGEIRILNMEDVDPKHLTGKNYKDYLPSILENLEQIQAELQQLSPEELGKVASIQKQINAEAKRPWIISGKQQLGRIGSLHRVRDAFTV